tara:strand:- start:1397 stop:2329 length:933 start_codon:yes stop_codon:yes gene_type:complete
MSLVITNSTYAGEFAGKYIAAALLSGDTLANNEITILPNVRYKSVLQKASTDDIVRDATCEFKTDQGTLTLTEKVLLAEEFQVNLEICKKELHQSWQALEMGFSAFADAPASFSDFVLAHVSAKVADRMEKNIWSGTNATTGQFDGLAVLLANDAALPAAQEIAAIAGGVLAANVIAELGKVVDAIPTSVYGKEDLRLYVSSNVGRAYTRALGGFTGTGNAGYDSKGTNQVLGNLFFDGVEIVVSKGMSDNTMIAAEKSNLFFGTGLLSDQNEVRVIDMGDTDGSQNIRVIMRFTAGVQYAQVTDIVLYA